MNAFGEEVIVDNADKAIAIASEKTGAIVNDYTAAPIYFSENSNGAHEWLIEFDKEPENLEAFTTEMDAALKSINSDYEAKRHKSIALGMPVVRSLKKGTFEEWLRRKGKLGGQHKIPRLSNERTNETPTLRSMQLPPDAVTNMRESDAGTEPSKRGHLPQAGETPRSGGG